MIKAQSQSYFASKKSPNSQTHRSKKIPSKMSRPSEAQAHFQKGEQVEVLKRDTGVSAFSYYPATVLRRPTSTNDKVKIEYIASYGGRGAKEAVKLENVRPVPPREVVNECFRVGDVVDAYCDEGWHKGTVNDILENSKYVVKFDGSSDGIVSQQCSLRLHREWDGGSSSWVPSPLDQKSMSEVEGKAKKMRLKITYGKKLSEPIFKVGSYVEVTSDDEGYKGAWYAALVAGSIGDDRFLVQYLTLLTEDETAPLKEVAHIRHIRPYPPEVPVLCFKTLDKVDAWYNEGWWEGQVSRVLRGAKYLVYFSSTGEDLVFAQSKLRPHLKWNGRQWIQEKPTIWEVNEGNPKAKLRKGTKVEVKSDEVGFQGAWFGATVVDMTGNDKYLVEYHSLLTEDETGKLREEASSSDMRPSPPHIQRLYPYELHEIVDAWYNDGWWVGCVVKVQKGLRYRVCFKTAEELEFEHCELRPHQEWTDGNWIIVSKDWEL